MPMENSTPAVKSSIRWWPGVLAVALAAASWIALEWFPHSSAQAKWMRQAGVGLVLGAVVIIWWFGFSRVPVSWKKWSGSALFFLAALAMLLFQYQGVSGDLMPRFGWRWSHDGPPPLASKEATGSKAIPRPSGAADFPQLLGPTRNGKLPGPELERDWKAHAPVELWRRQVGQAWSGFAVSGGAAVTQEQREDQELVVCYELATGNILWSHADETRFENSLGGVGPRAVPTIEDGRVYTMGATGILNCLELASGRFVWGKNVIEGNGAKVPEWGVSCSPLLVGDCIIVAAGQPNGATLAAYHKSNGTRLWISGTQSASYSSPTLATIDGTSQLLYFGPKSLVGVDPSSGRVFWDFPWHPDAGTPHVMVPIQLDSNSVLISSGYGQGSCRISLSRAETGAWVAREEWRTNRMKAKFTNLIDVGGFIYGIDDGIFACLDPKEEGKLRWRDGRVGHGQCLHVGNLFLITAEDGSVVLAEPNPDEWREIARFPVLSDKTWNPPTLAGEYLLVRNDREAVCLKLFSKALPKS